MFVKGVVLGLYSSSRSLFAASWMAARCSTGQSNSTCESPIVPFGASCGTSLVLVLACSIKLHITDESPRIPFEVRLAIHILFWPSPVLISCSGSVGCQPRSTRPLHNICVPTVPFEAHSHLQGTFVLLNVSCYSSSLSQYVQVCSDIRTYNPEIVAPNAIMPRYD